MVGLTEVARRRTKGFSLGMSARLGIAATLLGDPKVFMFDEPVNGLDPERTVWIRTLMKALAAEGRTVFVSSHLMSEMQNTADHLIVIGRGQLLADCTMEEFIARSSGQTVRVATPQADLLAKAVAEAGGSAVSGGNGTLIVSGLLADQVGHLALKHGVELNELTVVRARWRRRSWSSPRAAWSTGPGPNGPRASPRVRTSQASRPRNSPRTGGPATMGGADHGHHHPAGAGPARAVRPGGARRDPALGVHQDPLGSLGLPDA
jgi:ABC-2 type transport system ATP-binding protein